MTEEEWLACVEPERMVSFLSYRASSRKLRLLAVGYCKRVWHQLPDERSRNAVDLAERYAEGVESQESLNQAYGQSSESLRIWGPPYDDTLTYQAVRAAFSSLHQDARWAAVFTSRSAATGREKAPGELCHQADLLRDIFSNPFRPVTIDPSWLTSTIIALGRLMYEARDFSAMPILADALQDVGCDNEDILTHCRGPGPHVRGCWVVDSLLGKS